MKTLMVTVYFVGLVNIYNGTEIIVPRALKPIVRGTVTLHPHAPSIVIKGLKGGESDCDNLFGDWSDPLCTVTVLGGATVTLPPQNVVTGTVPKAPSLTAATLCPNASSIKSGYRTDPRKFAVRLTVGSNTLRACTKDKQWVSYVTTDGGELKIKFLDCEKKAMLKDDAVMWIVHEPIGTAGSDPKPHFWWYYEMYEGANACTGTPTAPTQAIPCPANFPQFHPGASGDVGCSNTNYP